MKTEEQLQRDVSEELKWDPMVHAPDLKVSVQGGLVILRGHVPNYAQKVAARRAAMRVKGVVNALDSIEVKLPFTDYRKDEDVARAILNALTWNVCVPDTVKATVDKGWVTLAGEVNWDFEREEAENAVSRVVGVRGVSNLVGIRRGDPGTDDRRQAIVEALERNVEIETLGIRVEADQGKIILNGEVRSWREREAAARVAWSAPGVSVVQNDIRISYKGVASRGAGR